MAAVGCKWRVAVLYDTLQAARCLQDQVGLSLVRFVTVIYNLLGFYYCALSPVSFDYYCGLFLTVVYHFVRFVYYCGFCWCYKFHCIVSVYLFVCVCVFVHLHDAIIKTC